MSQKIGVEHLARNAVIYVRQSTMTQVLGNLESQKRQYALADTARNAGFASVTVIDEDLGRSGSGLAARPGFQRLVAEVCAGAVGAVFCLEASRLARNGRDWHHLIDLCAMTGALVIDPDGVYDPRLMNDRLLLGLQGTMSEYELSLLRQRGLAARDTKAGRGALRFTLPPGFCWSEDERIELDPDERVREVIRLLFEKFRELGSARQVFLWTREASLSLPVAERNCTVRRIAWRAPAYHSVVQVLHNPIYAGAYAFGRSTKRTRAHRRRPCGDDGRPSEGHGRLERPDPRPSRGLHPLGAVRGEPAHAARERAHEATCGPQIRPWRSRPAHRADALRPLWAHDAGVLRHAQRSCPPLPVPR
jgi:DNA invertase Pin-like site-specific DNA recombinase